MQASGGLRGWSVLLGATDRRHLVGGGLVARIPLAVVGFSVLFFVRSVTGSFADAGFASGVAIAASALAGPVFGRIADRRGQRGALLVAGVGHPVAVAVLIVAGVSGQGLAVLTVAVLLVGATIVPAGAFTRARWSAMVAADDGLHLAFSIEAVADELVWVFGPALASLVSAAVDPAAGLVLSGVVAALGCAWLRRGTVAGPLTPDGTPTGRHRHAFVPWRSRRVTALLLASIALGLTFGVNDVTVVAWATRAGLPQIAGLVLTAYSIGSVTGGVLMSTVPARTSPWRVLLFAAAAVMAAWSLLATAPGLGWLFPFGLLAGATITPFTISTNRVLHEEVHGAVFTEAVAWVSTCVAGAMAVGSFVGGLVGQGGGNGFHVVAVSAPAVFVVVAVAVVLPGRRTRDLPPAS